MFAILAWLAIGAPAGLAPGDREQIGWALLEGLVTGLVLEQPLLLLNPAAVAAQAPVGPDHTWQGTTMAIGFWLFASPTARDDFGWRICFAIWP